MSGGIAYVLDEDGGFTAKCNRAMVELEPIEETRTPAEIAAAQRASDGLAAVMQDMLNQDSARLHTLLRHHVRYTNSAKAQSILADWDAHLPKFVKVVPVDYRRALTEMSREEAAPHLRWA